MILLAIDGVQYPSLNVLKYNVSSEILDGEGTGRTKAPGWRMFREPQGVIKNIDCELGLTMNTNSNTEFVNFIAVLDSFGSTQFRNVTFVTPAGSITQEMYGASYQLSLERVTKDDVTYWGTIKCKFIARQAVGT